MSFSSFFEFFIYVVFSTHLVEDAQHQALHQGLQRHVVHEGHLQD